MNLQKGLDLIVQFEGCSLTAYRDIVGILTIGFGHVGKNVVEGMSITQDEADAILAADIEHFLKLLKPMLPPLSDNEFCAVLSLVFNIGLGHFSGSTLLRLLKAGAPKEDIANEFPKWCKAGGQVIEGLLRRRLAEKALFLS